MNNQKGTALPIVIISAIVIAVISAVAYVTLGNKLPSMMAPTPQTEQPVAEEFEPIADAKKAPKEIDDTAINELDKVMMEVNKMAPQDNLNDLEL